MVGRGPVQVIYPPNNAAPGSGYSIDYSNQQTSSKMESFDIPNNIPIKQETTNFITPLTTAQVDSKYSQYILGEGYNAGGYPSYSQHLIPQPPPQETGIYFLPLEQLSNNPYKQQESEESLLFQKYPSTDTNWTAPSDGLYSNNGANNFMLPSTSYLPYNKEKSLQKEDEILAQLLDEGGFFEEFGNNVYMPSNDMLIPVQSADPLSNCYSPPQTTSPMQSVSPSCPPFITNDEPIIEGSSPSSAIVLRGGENSDPLVSSLNEATPSPSNEIMSLNDGEQALHNQVPVDDLQDILGELFGEDDFTLSNSFSHTVPDTNIIPTNNLTTTASFTIEDDDETSNNHGGPVEDMIIPSLTDLLPATKKPRMSNSSAMSIDDIPKYSSSSMDMTLPLDKPKRKPRHHHPSSSSSSSSSPSDSSSKLPPSPPSKSSTTNMASGGMLFGQHEDEIITKLLIPQDRKGTKPITRDKLVTMPVEEFNALLDEASLSEIEVAFMKEWRRRGKNKMAAQIARKRKREELFELEDDMDTLRQRRAQLKQSVESLTVLIASYKRRAEAAEKKIYKHYSATHGSLVSEETHTIHVTDDGKTMLIPRMSNQVLLV